MRHTLQLAALTLALTASAPAQFHFPQHITKNKSQKEDVSWLAPYATPEPDGRENELIHDIRFKAFLRDHLKAPQTFWNENESLPDTVMEFLEVPGKVVLDDNRFLAIDGCVPHFCPSRGLLFVDLGTDHALVVFAAIDWTKDNRTPTQSGAEYTMWIFANHPLSDGPIPPALTRAISHWTAQPSSASTTPQNITNTVLVDPDGTPHQVPPATVGVTSIPQQSEQKPKS